VIFSAPKYCRTAAEVPSSKVTSNLPQPAKELQNRSRFRFEDGLQDQRTSVSVIIDLRGAMTDQLITVVRRQQ
jgi:hypothetical protein